MNQKGNAGLYAPYYAVFGGIASVFVIGAKANDGQYLNANQFVSLLFAFLTVGILQRYIRHRLFDSPKEAKPKRSSFVAELNQVRLERLTRQYDAMSRKDREAMIERYSENYLAWPEPW